MELSATELRIGNLVTDKWSVGKYPFKIVSIGKNICHYFGNQEFSAKYEDLEPIPLTEEWLLKFGLLKTREGSFLLGSYELIKYENSYRVLLPKNGILSTIKFVHELQNFYFALTGEELTNLDAI